ncbi:unnamed protein product [Mytilus edulis]|uniref:Tyr recombinase domain-containing protein n=1 Tax=Mytilus edulis TaxID=6550 RepID=A0A8S3RJ57_MYTED|nr:unnamed protein product [Mytilus edulis]
MKQDLKSSGFFVNKDKSIWQPTKKLIWLGFVWDLNTHTLEIPSEKIQRFKNDINSLHSVSPTARQLAKITGKIISFMPSLGNICRIMSRNMLMLISTSRYWDEQILLTSNAISEINFWHTNCELLPSKTLFSNIFLPDKIVYTDASSFAAAGYTVETFKKVVHKMWTFEEKQKSSTYRELKAVLITLNSLMKYFHSRLVKIYTDNQNVVRIITAGSMNAELQVLAIEIFNLCVQNNISIEVDWRFQFSYWKDLQSIQNPSLRDFASKLPNIAEASKSKNTVKKYSYAFKRFSVWCSNYDLCPLPASVITVAVYLSFLIQSEVSSSVLNGAFYGIKWEHDLNLYSNVFTSDFLSIVLEGGVRLLSKPVNKKEPITHDIIKRVIDKFGLSTNLADLRICCLVLLSYAGFLRYSELSHLKASNLRFYDSHVEITIVSSKTDVYRQGNVVVIAKTNSDLCPVAMLKRYLEAANISISSDEFIFRAISFLKSRNSHILCKANKPLSYTRARELLLSTLSEVGCKKEQFGLHSLRSGGVSEAAHNRIPERLLKSHGRWKTDLAKDGYIKENLKNRLSVSKSLNL